MHTISKLLPLFLIPFLIAACRNDDSPAEDTDLTLEELLEANGQDQGMSFFELPAADDFSQIPQDPKNPLTAEKVALGKMLYHETALGIAPMEEIGMGTYSCASCHFAKAGFQAGRFQGIGDGGIGFGVAGEGRIANSEYDEDDLDVQPLRSPTTLNVAYQKNMLWNGQFGATGVNIGTESQWTPNTPKAVNNLGYEGVETQAIAGLEVHRMKVGDVVRSIPEYQERFDAIFSEFEPADRYTHETAGLAIAAYERTLLPNQSKFQQYLKGDRNALSENQKIGAQLFFGKAECVSCHTGPALNKMEFVGLGLLDLVDCGEATFKTPENDPANLGRSSFTKNNKDNFKFKIPQLYNLKDSPFYMHGSTLKSIREVIMYKNAGIPQNPGVPLSQIDPRFKPLHLTPTEVDQLTEFIEEALYDPNLSRYEPETLFSGNCFPMNDVESKEDLGCD